MLGCIVQSGSQAQPHRIGAELLLQSECRLTLQSHPPLLPPGTSLSDKFFGRVGSLHFRFCPRPKIICAALRYQQHIGQEKHPFTFIECWGLLNGLSLRNTEVVLRVLEYSVEMSSALSCVGFFSAFCHLSMLCIAICTCPAYTSSQR